MSHCINCHIETNGNFCPNCGQSAKLHRIDGHYISHEIQHVLHFEKGFPFTVWQILVRPGTSIKGYIQGRRDKYVKPVPFLVIASLIYSLINGFFHVENNYMNSAAPANAHGAMHDSHVTHIFQWVQGHYGYANILMGVFIAFFLRLFFRKHQYNIFEITVLLCFLMGVSMLFLGLAALLVGITKLESIYTIANLVFLGYMTWAIGQFYDPKKVASYVKALLAYLVGGVLFFIALMVIGIACDLLMK